ncbi:hypothetical protein GQ54DRAFT_8185 [Martensiomyces pterosporus]|nr:hypothetical protein GQ54DRAFT_8185 [Martensiomyces pterosporus]
MQRIRRGPFRPPPLHRALTPGLDGNPVLLTDPVEVEQAVSAFFEGHFTSMLEQDVQILPEWEEAYRPRTDIDYSSVLAPLSPAEFEGFLMHTPCKKAPGPSMVDFEMLLHLHQDARDRLLAQVNEVLATGQVPQYWVRSNIIPIPKTVDGAPELSKWRPIALQTLAECCRFLEKPLEILDVDISKAYDSVSPKLLQTSMERLGIPEQIIRLVMALHEHREVSVLTAHRQPVPFTQKCGLAQGDSLSPPALFLSN